DGQLWGNPLYNWGYLRRTRYRWWTERLRVSASLFDSVRIDHFRALASYWAVPVGSGTAKTGVWLKGPGMDFIRAARRAVPGCSLIAEDLGLLDDGVRRLLKDSGLPGMKVLQFAFDPKSESDYLPHNFIKDCVGYIGTHDNDTVRGWLKNADPDEARFAMQYFSIASEGTAHWSFIRGLYATPANRVIVQMQDVLGLGSAARMNTPGYSEGNWLWRMRPGAASADTAKKLGQLAGTYCRGRKAPA
ncbi:MAG: 4-alpha-glucanotransferase, partial [Oscillospiraceae bacterium]|nr:4-alpha-glucanotransferase [Oscillospiraceae bacterium]